MDEHREARCKANPLDSLSAHEPIIFAGVSLGAAEISSGAGRAGSLQLTLLGLHLALHSCQFHWLWLHDLSQAAFILFTRKIEQHTLQVFLHSCYCCAPFSQIRSECKAKSDQNAKQSQNQSNFTVYIYMYTCTNNPSIHYHTLKLQETYKLGRGWCFLFHS